MELTKQQYEFVLNQEFGINWAAYNGDSTEVLKNIPDNSIHLSVGSPPFIDLYTYSATERDIGNSKTDDIFYRHYSMIVSEKLRITKPGRVTCVHTQNVPAMQVKDGYIGLKDFPGELIRLYESLGWIWWGDVHIAKNPQAQAIRTKAHQLMFKTLEKDSAKLRPAIGDRVLIFLKPGQNNVPVTPIQNEEMSNDDWIEWANPIWITHTKKEDALWSPIQAYWLDINESSTLQHKESGKYYEGARTDKDVKHMCALQLDTIERCIKLYSNPGEIVLDEFAGIFSTPYMANLLGRKSIGIELKPEWYTRGVKNLHISDSEVKAKNFNLLSLLENN